VFTMRGKLRVERDAPMPNERIATAEQRELIVLAVETTAGELRAFGSSDGTEPKTPV
jgi:hypothetical protein